MKETKQKQKLREQTEKIVKKHKWVSRKEID